MLGFCSSAISFQLTTRHAWQKRGVCAPSVATAQCSLKPYLNKLSLRKDLDEHEATDALAYAVSDEANDCEVAAFLSLLAAKGETVTEITAIAAFMRSQMIPVNTGETLLDIVGTGGDGANTVNISTAASIVAAAAGCKVGKHGNRSVSSKCGSADVLEELGIILELSPEHVAECIKNVGIGFMFAPNHHPCLKRLARVRKALGIRTVFNIMGPLLNPAAASCGLIGVFSLNYLPVLAKVLTNLGMKRGMVVHTEGLDELSNTGIASVMEINGQNVHKLSLDPTSLGIDRCELSELKGGDVKENARILRDVLSGKGTAAVTDAVALNAGAGCYLYGLDSSMKAGVERAKQVIRSGTALDKLEEWSKVSQRELHTVDVTIGS